MNENQLKELDLTMTRICRMIDLGTCEFDYIKAQIEMYAESYSGKYSYDCSTCKHRSVSKYIEPCFMCDEIKEYNNYEPNK